MLRDAKQFLTLCSSRFPSPRHDQRHNLTLIDGTMVLTLMFGDTYQSFNMNEADLDRPIDDLLDELSALLEPTLDAAERPVVPSS